MKEIYKYIGLAFLGMISGVAIYFRGTDGRYGLIVTKPAALIYIFLWFLWIPYAFYINAKLKKEKFETKIYVCEHCNEQYPTKWVQIELCPKCNHKLKLRDSDECG